MSPPWPRFWSAPPICSTTFASTPGSDCYATSGWPTEPANYPAACCPTRPTAGSCSATASGSRKNWRASSRASQRSMRCTSTRSAPNRRHATSQPLSEPRAARRRTATEQRAGARPMRKGKLRAGGDELRNSGSVGSVQLTTTLVTRGPAAAIVLDDEQVAAIGEGAKRFPVHATVNGFSWRTTVTPMRGETLLGLNRAVRESAGVQAGDTVEVAVQLDTAPREVDVPQALASALAG